MTQPTHGSLFSGYGGLGMAIEHVFDAKTIWHSEIDHWPAQTLKQHWPDTPNLGDITRIDWDATPPVDILSGGSPCQNMSTVGQREGIDGPKSSLWAHMRQAITRLQPKLVIWENVYGALMPTGRTCPMGHGHATMAAHPTHTGQAGIARVLGDLADNGYDARWMVVQSSHAGLPHARKRIFLIAHKDAIPPIRRRATANPNPGPLLPTPCANFQQDWTSIPSHGATLVGQLRDIHANTPPGSPTRWGRYSPAIDHATHTLVRVPPAPTIVAKNGTIQANPAFGEWMMGLPEHWITGIPNMPKFAAGKMIGNGVAPPQAQLALTLILDSIHADHWQGTTMAGPAPKPWAGKPVTDGLAWLKHKHPQ
ncbi:MAG: DNA (cytosine-5-)-methyltransferase [Propionibacteriaceae bacterium]|jgi:DNA (cytosine-5)-methyltransferase 1|nr:DNA (cytosine-5-)-methyltransferase [Propionibacteriaceae bacterium]